MESTKVTKDQSVKGTKVVAKDTKTGVTTPKTTETKKPEAKKTEPKKPMYTRTDAIVEALKVEPKTINDWSKEADRLYGKSNDKENKAIMKFVVKVVNVLVRLE